MHTGTVTAQAVDREGRFAVTGGADRTVRVWSVADGKLQRTIWIPVGPDPVGDIFAVAISPDGTTIAQEVLQRLETANIPSIFSVASPGRLSRGFAAIFRMPYIS
jgi:WD40 repeat protein